LHDIRERIELELLEDAPDPLQHGDGDAGANGAAHPRPGHGAFEPLDYFEYGLNSAEPMTEGDQIELGRLWAADGERRRKPCNLSEGRTLKLRLHLEIEMDFPDSDGPPRPAYEHLRNLDGMC
jgi:hypothetical protein